MKKTESTDSRSLKTFYLYVAVVVTIIIISLIIKGILIIQHSKFNSAHDFVLAVTQNNNVKEIIAFHPQVPAVAVLTIEDVKMPYPTLIREYGITPDAYLQVGNAADVNPDVTAFMWSSVLHTENWQSDLTIIDKVRLTLFAKSVTTNNKTNEAILLAAQAPQMDTTITNALTDQDIADENITIQIINATDISGFGQRLSRTLTNMGANVVEVSTAQNVQNKTTVQYYGDSSYTVNKIQKLLDVKPMSITRQPIANIIITLGTDEQKTKSF